MGFLKKLRFWKRRHDDAVINCDIATTDNLTSETGTQVSYIEMILRYDAGTQVDSKLTREASTQTPNDNEPENRTNGGGAEKEREQMKSKIAALEKFLEEKDHHIWELNAMIEEMKGRQGSEIQFIRRKQEIEKSALLCKIRAMTDEILSLKELLVNVINENYRNTTFNKLPKHYESLIINSSRHRLRTSQMIKDI
jgi:hypothetical protein